MSGSQDLVGQASDIEFNRTIPKSETLLIASSSWINSLEADVFLKLA